ncbi:MAG: KH domain-containing protein [Candidatus Thermoplasmatota archaeon]
MKYLRIPKERVGVLIGPKGETKRIIESTGKIILEVDSEEGEVIINDSGCNDPVLCLKAEDVIRAIGRGFSPENAMKLFKDDVDFLIFDIHEYVGKSDSHVSRVKSRIIGREGKTRRTIERLTSANISIYGHTVAVIVEYEYMDVTKRAIDMLLSGSKHSKVYRFIEREMKRLRYSDQW